MRFAFIDVQRASWPIVVMCDVLGVSCSGFYAWLKRPISSHAIDDGELGAAIAASHRASDGRYGSPRVHRDLEAKGLHVGRKRVERLMREKGFAGRSKRRWRRTTDSNHASPIAPNILARNFVTASPNVAWVTDVTYIATTSEGFAYLAVILDLFSRRVVGWAISATNDTALALDALNAALRSRHVVAGLVHHSDRGSPYASDVYRAALAARGIVGSMSRKGDCWDNAVAESFFATLRVELVDEERYAGCAAAASSIGAYIDGFYNLRRRHSYLDYVSPIEFELKNQVAALAA